MVIKKEERKKIRDTETDKELINCNEKLYLKKPPSLPPAPPPPPTIRRKNF